MGAIIKYSIYRGGRDIFDKTTILVPQQNYPQNFHTPPLNGLIISYPNMYKIAGKIGYILSISILQKTIIQKNNLSLFLSVFSSIIIKCFPAIIRITSILKCEFTERI